MFLPGHVSDARVKKMKGRNRNKSSPNSLVVPYEFGSAHRR